MATLASHNNRYFTWRFVITQTFSITAMRGIPRKGTDSLSFLHVTESVSASRSPR